MAVHTKRGPQPVRTAGRLGVSGRYPVCAGSLRLIGVTLIGEALTGRSVVFVLLDHRGLSSPQNDAPHDRLAVCVDDTRDRNVNDQSFAFGGQVDCLLWT